MRRPRGPGGRFLTADEIAAQKSSAHHPVEPDSPGTDGPSIAAGESSQPSPSQDQHAFSGFNVDSPQVQSHPISSSLPLGQTLRLSIPSHQYQSHHPPSFNTQIPPPSAASDAESLLDVSYHPLSHPDTPLSATSRLRPDSHTSFQGSHSGSAHYQSKDPPTTQSDPIVLRTQFPQMHHVTHSHTHHPRTRNLNFSEILYGQEDAGLERRDQDLIQFGAQDGSVPSA
jgi:nuclear transcription factor Y, alpha